MSNAPHWDWFQEVGLVEMLDQYLVKEFVGDNIQFVCTIWRRLLRIQESIFKELCVEFITIVRFKMRDDIYDMENFTSCLGGQRRECSLAKLAKRLDLYYQFEVMTTDFNTFIEH